MKRESFLQKRIRFARLFGDVVNYPKNKAECARWFEELRSELSPENLSNDGELGAIAMRFKINEIKKCWRELEKIQGEPEKLNNEKIY